MTIPLTDQLAAARHALRDLQQRSPSLVALGRCTQDWALFQQAGLAAVVGTLTALAAASAACPSLAVWTRRAQQGTRGDMVWDILQAWEAHEAARTLHSPAPEEVRS